MPHTKIGIIGAGIAGLGAAWALHPSHHVTVFEKESRLGGHSNTVDVPLDDGSSLPVDTGFIVYNERNYPNLTRLFNHLDVPVEKSDMSFAVSAHASSFEYCGTGLSGMFAQPKHLFDASYWQFLKEIKRFFAEAQYWLQQTPDPTVTLGEFLEAHRLSQSFQRYFLLPMGAAIWSSSLQGMLAYPALTFLRFFDNHGLLTVNQQPQWHTVSGGSREYVQRLITSFAGQIVSNAPVTQVAPGATGVAVITADGQRYSFDHVVIAAHADEALAMIVEPTEQERDILGQFHYQANEAVLHTDSGLMPLRKRAWASWNVLMESEAGEDKVCLTYWMNRLQNLPKQHPVFVTLNPVQQPLERHVIGRYTYHHPQFTLGAIDAQERIKDIQGQRRLWFAGAYQRYGFHEDGLLSGFNVATKIGATIPWWDRG